MSTAANYTKKQLQAMMERYAYDLLQPLQFDDLPVKFAYEFTQFGQTVSCHLRTTQGIVLGVPELVEWFEKLPKKKQEEILKPPGPQCTFRTAAK